MRERKKRTVWRAMPSNRQRKEETKGESGKSQTSKEKIALSSSPFPLPNLPPICAYFPASLSLPLPSPFSFIIKVMFYSQESAPLPLPLGQVHCIPTCRSWRVRTSGNTLEWPPMPEMETRASPMSSRLTPGQTGAGEQLQTSPLSVLGHPCPSLQIFNCKPYTVLFYKPPTQVSHD